MEEVGPYTNHTVSKDSSADSIAVSMKNKVVIIEIRCPWREGLLLEIIDALSNLHLDSHSVQSSTVDGIISLIIQSTIKGPNPVSAATIKQELQRIAWNS
ncbi:transcription factor GLABRA 3-like [Morus notabilis]|uniref:transcription factor GLABRA 3-like n=1 Tax=Morus notabilis TaxID=981085 RepID=UPI000CECF3A5|nr:transcription factor GLABRA 3-like [Morus notabilis]